MAKKKPANEQTSESMVSKTSKQLDSHKSTPAQRSVAESALTQTRNKTKKN